MNPRSLRYRLVLWYAAWLVAVFAVAGALLLGVALVVLS